jgi:hypothetical protein
LAALVFAALCLVGLSRYGDPRDAAWAALAVGLFVLSALVGGYLVLRRAAASGLVVGGALGILAHGVMVGGLVPHLEPLWPGVRAAEALSAAGLNPRNGAPGPVAVTGYAEPSLVFTLGTRTELTDAAGAAAAVAEGRPAIVETREDARFRAALAAEALTPREAGAVSGTNYSDGQTVTLRLYRGEPQTPAPTSEPIGVKRFIDIVEVGPRDGLQNEAQILSPEERVGLIRRLEQAGARRIEAASFVNPKRVPQMADAEADHGRPAAEPDEPASAWCSTSAAGTAAWPPAATRPMWWSAPPTVSR